MLGRDEEAALETMENVVAALRALPERDRAITTLVEAIEDDRARLLALAMGSHLSGRKPPRMSTVARTRDV